MRDAAKARERVAYGKKRRSIQYVGNCPEGKDVMRGRTLVHARLFVIVLSRVALGAFSALVGIAPVDAQVAGRPRTFALGYG